MQHELINTQQTGHAESLYDRFAHLYGLTFKVNRYGQAIENYFRDKPWPLSSGARILDAGCGTGLLTLVLLRVLAQPAQITAIDLSTSSLLAARRAVTKALSESRRQQPVTFAQANILSLPFADNSFDFVVTSGALEYVPLHEGFRELARVIAPGGYLFHLPVRPSPIGSVLEVMFRFKIHPPAEVLRHTENHFSVLDHHRFSPLEPISWTKTAILSQKK